MGLRSRGRSSEGSSLGFLFSGGLTSALSPGMVRGWRSVMVLLSSCKGRFVEVDASSVTSGDPSDEATEQGLQSISLQSSELRAPETLCNCCSLQEMRVA